MHIQEKNIPALKSFLSQTRTVTLICHTKPDGDAVGSLLGLYHYLKEKHEVAMIAPSEVPDYLSFLPDSDHIVAYSEENEDVCQEILNDSEIIFCLDFSGLSRVGDMEQMLSTTTCPKVIIDHHLDPESFDEYRYWSTEAAATCQLIYHFIEELEDKKKINADAANCLFVGLLTDTGAFKHANTSADVFKTAAGLVDLGADNTWINQKLFDKSSESRLRLLGHLLCNQMVVKADQHAAYFVVDEATNKKYNIQSGDTEGMVNYALSMDGIVFACLVSWSEKYIKLSLRSKGGFPASEIAKTYFNGGGHLNASGGRFDGELTECLHTLDKAIELYTDQLKTEFKKLQK
jgi:bifunctional oligoribonuclease and PAP phosphatase NrnA